MFETKTYLLIIIVSILSSSLIGQDKFSKLFGFDDIVPNPTEFIQIGNDSFVINLITNVDGERSSTILKYNALEDELDRVDLKGYEPNRRSTLKIKDHYYLYGKNKNLNADSLTLVKMNADFDILSVTNLDSPEEFQGQTNVFSINDRIYGVSLFDLENGEKRKTHIKKLDTLYNLIWSNNYGDDVEDKIDQDFVITDDQNILSSGIIKYNNDFERYAHVTKYDTLGNVIWRYEHHEALSSGPNFVQMVLLSNSEMIIKISKEGEGNWDEDPTVLLWLDQEGNKVREKTLIAPESEILGVEFIEGKGDYFFGHGIYLYDNPDSLYQEWFGLIVKFKNDGDVIWEKKYRHPEYTLNIDRTTIVDLKEQENGDLVALARLDRVPDISLYRTWLFRLDSLGCPDPAYCDEYINFTSTEEDEIDFEPLNIYPNPSKGNITIDLPSYNGQARLDITNNLGQTLINKEFQNKMKLTLDLSNYSKGIYYIKFQEAHSPIIYRTSLVLN